MYLLSKKNIHSLVLLSTILSATCHCAAFADNQEVDKPLWEAGLVGLGIEQLAYPGSSQRINRALFLPYGIYRGPVLRAEDSGVRLRALNNVQLELNVGMAAAFGTNSSEIPIREGMPKLGLLAEIGPQLIVRLGRVDPLRALDKHPWSIELPIRTAWDFTHLRFRGVSFEPQLVFKQELLGRFDINASIGVLTGSRRLTDYYYSVDERYATTNRPTYQANAGLISSRVSLRLGYQVTAGLRLLAFWRGENTKGAANETSPLIDQQSGWSAGFGFAWRIFKSSQSGAR